MTESSILTDRTVSWFQRQVLAWYDRYGRSSLPWQQEPTPYRVWVSEIMLQQTQVRTVIPYFRRFMASFPDVEALAAAGHDQVMHHWSGLGYYARARNLHRCAKEIVSGHQGKFPETQEELEALPGIGRSTAGAILSLAMEQPTAILDGNVKRVLARFRAIDGWPGKTSVNRQLWQTAETLTPETRNRAYTQAMMDLGALVCTRTRPDCPACPLAAECRGYRSGQPEQFPGRKPRKVKPEKETWLLILTDNAGRVRLEQRAAEGLWGGLYGFPEFPSRDSLRDWLTRYGLADTEVVPWQRFRHTFSHFHLMIHPVHVRTGSPDRVAENELWMLPGEAEVGLAAPTERLLKQLPESQET